MEAQGLEYLEKVRQAFLSEAAKQHWQAAGATQIVVINADRPAEEVHADVLRHAEARSPAPKSEIQNPKPKSRPLFCSTRMIFAFFSVAGSTPTAQLDRVVGLRRHGRGDSARVRRYR